MNNNGRRPRYGNNSFLDEQSDRSQKSGYKRTRRRSIPFGYIIVADILIAAVVLLFFYLSSYVWKKDVKPEVLNNPGPNISQPADNNHDIGDDPNEDTPDVPTSTPDNSDWRAKFADKFTDGEVVKTDNSYQSANVNVSIDKVEKDGTVYFIADIYLADIKYFKTAFGKNELGQNEFVHHNLKNNNGIVGINGDNCRDNPCLIIRNGSYYDWHQSSTFDTLVMYNDGSMETISGPDVDFEAIKAEAPYQTWGFGPMLLDSNGQPMSEFNSTVAGSKNPRTAIGYYEPGHYCFVAVDGRREDYSLGLTMTELSQLMFDLGCKRAFNLDGGGSTQMAYIDEYVNIPSKDRTVNDMIYITDNAE